MRWINRIDSTINGDSVKTTTEMTENFRQTIFLIQNDELNDRRKIFSPVKGDRSSCIDQDEHRRECNSSVTHHFSSVFFQ